MDEKCIVPEGGQTSGVEVATANKSGKGPQLVIWDDQSLDGRNALQDEDAEACRDRNGLARPGVQHDEGDLDPRRTGAGQGNAGIRITTMAHEQRTFGHWARQDGHRN